MTAICSSRSLALYDEVHRLKYSGPGFAHRRFFIGVLISVAENLLDRSRRKAADEVFAVIREEIETERGRANRWRESCARVRG